MRVLRVVAIVVVVLAVLAGGFIARSQQPLIPAVARPDAARFDRAVVEQGARLAAIGNCRTCHTAPDGADYAGNRPIPTPFGTIYSTNITPAPGNGIGDWSEAAFTRAMRQGVARRGEHLYPAFPYDHFTMVDDTDLHALYAFLMTRKPVDAAPPGNTLPFPLNQRWLMVFWNLLFLDAAPFRPEPAHDAAWNRGAYLVAGLGHCGACHTPRNLLGAEKKRQALSGGEGEAWVAPALTEASPAPVPWQRDQLFTYLRQGVDPVHGAAAGPMRPVTDELAQADEADVQAIATYLADISGPVSPERRQHGADLLAKAAAPAPPAKPGEELGAELFAGACAACHIGRADMLPPHGIGLGLSTAVNDASPVDAIRIVLHGIQPAGERAGPLMPGFGGSFSDAQLAALLGYVRAHYSAGPAWTGLTASIQKIRGDKAER